MAGTRIASFCLASSAGAAPPLLPLPPPLARLPQHPAATADSQHGAPSSLSLSVRRAHPLRLWLTPTRPQSSTTNKPDVIKTKEEKVAEKSSSALKSFISGGAGGVAAVLVGESLSPSSSPSSQEWGVHLGLASRSTLARRRQAQSSPSTLLAGQPFDLTKVRLQTAAPGQYTGAMDVVRQTMARDGVRGCVSSSLAASYHLQPGADPLAHARSFYRGMGPPLAGGALARSCVFPCAELTLPCGHCPSIFLLQSRLCSPSASGCVLSPSLSTVFLLLREHAARAQSFSAGRLGQQKADAPLVRRAMPWARSSSTP